MNTKPLDINKLERVLNIMMALMTVRVEIMENICPPDVVAQERIILADAQALHVSVTALMEGRPAGESGLCPR